VTVTARALAGGLCAALVGGAVALAVSRRQTAEEPAPALDAAAVGPTRRPPPTTTLVVRITDRGTPVGARVLLFAGSEPLRIGSLDLYGARQTTTACVLAPGVVGSWDGLILARGVAEIPVGSDDCAPGPAIPYGRYHVWVWRGIEYEIWQGEVDLSAGRGRVELAAPLERAWTPYGTLAADLHVHAYASNDSGLPNRQRVVAQVAAGIQVIALSDHNASGDLDVEIAQLGLTDVVASIASNELTSDLLHVGVYPVAVVADAPRGGSPSEEDIEDASAQEVLALARQLGPTGIVQLNHPRLRAAALFDATEWDGLSWPPPFPLTFDAIEVVAGHTAFNASDDRRLDESVRDFYTLVDHGRLVTPVGNSDTHDLNWILDGTARTYVFLDEPMTQPFDEAAFLAALRARRDVATSGPWLDVEIAPAKDLPTAGPGQSIRARGMAWVDVTVAQASFVHVDRIRVAVGGLAGKTIEVPPGARTFRWTGVIDVGAVDTWIGVTADGDTPIPSELTGTYFQQKLHVGVTPLAIAAPILVDADGDGRWRRGDANVVLKPVE